MQLNSDIPNLICIFVGFCSGFYFIWILIRQQASKNWPMTTGEILESTLREDSDGWYPFITYRYTVQERSYTNNRLYFYLCNGSSKKNATKHLAPYPVGKNVTIYYNPQNPDDSVIDRRMPLWWLIFWLFFTLLWFAFGIGISEWE